MNVLSKFHSVSPDWSVGVVHGLVDLVRSKSNVAGLCDSGPFGWGFFLFTTLLLGGWRWWLISARLHPSTKRQAQIVLDCKETPLLCFEHAAAQTLPIEDPYLAQSVTDLEQSLADEREKSEELKRTLEEDRNTKEQKEVECRELQDNLAARRNQIAELAHRGQKQEEQLQAQAQRLERAVNELRRRDDLVRESEARRASESEVARETHAALQVELRESNS